MLLFTALWALLPWLSQAAARPEVFGFSVAGPANYRRYDWGRLTSIAWATDASVVAYARGRGAVPSFLAQGYQAAVTGAGAAGAWNQSQWVEQQVAYARAQNLRGINFDLEVPLGAAASGAYTRLVAATAAGFHAALPGSQVSVDVAWSPAGVDGRFYDAANLAGAADLLFVMAYDMQSQIWGRCVASANSPAPLVEHGLRQYLQLGVAPAKLVLGLPWYGYRYRCQPDRRWTRGELAAWDGVCLLQPTSFRGAACSDAAGVQVAYGDIQKLLRELGDEVEVRWDAVQRSPFFSYLDAQGVLFQVWYDNPRSLRLKYGLARQYGLAGVGMWNLDTLDYDSPEATEETAAMWTALDAASSGGPEA